jgi:4-hydroxybenzoate polyprenyltransferase
VAGGLIGDHVLRHAGAPGALTPGRLLLIFVAAAGARTFALAMNRIIDHRLDAANPRTGSARCRRRRGGPRRCACRPLCTPWPSLLSASGR